MSESAPRPTGSAIEGVHIQPLRRICDERGAIFHMLRCDSPLFERFGEVYFAQAYPGVVKGWHKHSKMTQLYAVVSGMIKLVLCDRREGSPSYDVLEEHYVGEDNYCLVRIPPGVVSGYKAYGTKPALVCNCADLPHEDGEMERFDPSGDEIPYDWRLVHR